ncbi:hypothetical protein ACFPH8_07230 [Bizionia hallyeonensis]|uniref:Sugar transporter n=1 Tax=Bizionia hallyeonensis TaxID=1123757 RepID=A0ABW0C634_9FLAO
MSTIQKPPKSFWIISILALIWNLMGVSAYLTHAFMTEDALQKLPEAEQTLYADLPAWVTAAFAIAVFGGTFGAIGLLLRKKWARIVFLISLIGIIIQMSHNFFISNNMEVYGPGALIMPIMVLVIGVYLIMFSKSAIAKGWIS